MISRDVLSYWSLLVFFFSSRRRHTRLQGDWSSDVCSSERIRRHTRLQGDWSSDVCSSDLMFLGAAGGALLVRQSLVLPLVVSGVVSCGCAIAVALTLRDEIGRASCRERV